MSQRSDKPKGSIYDPFFVREMIRSTRGPAGQPQQHARLNILDASQPRRGRLTNLVVVDYAASPPKKGKK